jgi:glucose/arabinose dehydrogenase
MRRRHLFVITLTALVCFAGAFVDASADVLPFWLKVEKSFDSPVEVGAAGQSPTGEFWILERATGKVRVMRAGKEDENLTIPVTSTCQAGLLGIAFDPNHASNGRALLYYVDATNRARVDELFYRPGVSLALGGHVLDLGPVTDDCRPGGGLAVGKDGKLYISVGDMGTSGMAQDNGSLKGKVLRANLDGSVPADNPTPGSLVWAKGFRNARGLAHNPNTARPGGTFYVTDMGAASPAASDEINGVKAGGNYAWDVCSGAGCSGYEAPLAAYGPTALIAPAGVATITSDALGPAHTSSLLVAAPDDGGASKPGRVRELVLSGAERDLLDKNLSFYDPRGDADGTFDAACPTEIAAVATGNDGQAYLASGATGANMGIYRVYRDAAGPREISGKGAPVPLTVAKDGTQLQLVWEDAGTLDAGRAKRYATGQRAEAYEVFEGTLPVGASYGHAPVLSTNGTLDGTGRRKISLTPGSGNRYYIVSAQCDNLEGTLGRASSSTERPLPATMTRDYCTTIGWGRSVNTCAREFQNETTGELIRLKDYNPRSPTYGQWLSLSDFRGLVVKLALTSKNCGWCQIEAQQEDPNDKAFRGRDFLFVSVFTVNYGIWNVYTDAQCATEISAWANSYNSNTPILCDRDVNGDNYGDVSNWYDQCNCAPQNFYIDQGGVIYKYVQGAQFQADVASAVLLEVNPETCE